MKSRMVKSTRCGRSIGAVCDALGISSSSADGIAAAIARPALGWCEAITRADHHKRRCCDARKQFFSTVLTGRREHRDEQSRIDARHALEVRHEVVRFDELASNLQARGHFICKSRRKQSPASAS